MSTRSYQYLVGYFYRMINGESGFGSVDITLTSAAITDDHRKEIRSMLMARNGMSEVALLCFSYLGTLGEPVRPVQSLTRRARNRRTA